MDLKEAMSKLENSRLFKDWRKEHKESFLTYAFIMVAEEIKPEWQIGYYIPGKDKVSTFTVSSKVHVNPESEMLKKDSVLELDFDKVKVTQEEAMKTAEKIQKTKYSEHQPSKKMVILQKLSLGQVWNITYITKTLKTLNIKIDSGSGKVVKHELIELFKFDT